MYLNTARVFARGWCGDAREHSLSRRTTSGLRRIAAHCSRIFRLKSPPIQEPLANTGIFPLLMLYYSHAVRTLLSPIEGLKLRCSTPYRLVFFRQGKRAD